MSKKVVELNNFSINRKLNTLDVEDKAVEKIHATPTPSVVATPKVSEEPTTRMSIDVPLRFRQQLQMEAVKKNIPLAKLVRQVLEDFVKANT